MEPGSVWHFSFKITLSFNRLTIWLINKWSWALIHWCIKNPFWKENPRLKSWRTTSESVRLPACFSSWSSDTLKPRGGLLTASPLADGLTPTRQPHSLICRSCGGELGSAWVAGQHAGPPWLAPVILPSHSSAGDINNNSTSGFTLLSHVNPFHCSTDCHCSRWPAGHKHQPTPLLQSHSSDCQSSFLRLIHCCSVSFSSFTQSQSTHLQKSALTLTSQICH